MSTDSTSSVAEPEVIVADLFDDGLLWAINRVLFHPRGFALAASHTGQLSIIGNGTEPWKFLDGHTEDQKFAAFEALLHRAADANPSG